MTVGAGGRASAAASLDSSRQATCASTPSCDIRSEIPVRRITAAGMCSPCGSAMSLASASTTLEDAALRLTNWDLTEGGLTTLVNERFSAKASEILPMYRDAGPGKTPYLIQAQIFS